MIILYKNIYLKIIMKFIAQEKTKKIKPYWITNRGGLIEYIKVFK